MPVGAAATLRMVPNVPLPLPLVCRMSALEPATTCGAVSVKRCAGTNRSAASSIKGVPHVRPSAYDDVRRVIGKTMLALSRKLAT